MEETISHPFPVIIKGGDSLEPRTVSGLYEEEPGTVLFISESTEMWKYFPLGFSRLHVLENRGLCVGRESLMWFLFLSVQGEKRKRGGKSAHIKVEFLSHPIFSFFAAV